MRSDPVEVQELESLTRRYAGLIRSFRFDALRQRLERGRPAPVLRNRCGFAGDRWTIWLGDGSALRLALYQPLRADVTEVSSIRWVHHMWRVEARTIAGTAVRLLAFRVTFHPRRDQGPNLGT